MPRNGDEVPLQMLYDMSGSDKAAGQAEDTEYGYQYIGSLTSTCRNQRNTARSTFWAVNQFCKAASLLILTYILLEVLRCTVTK